MKRRSLLLGAGAALFTPRIGRTQTSGVWASYFDGYTSLVNDNLPNMPANNPYWLLSYWYAANPPGSIWTNPGGDGGGDGSILRNIDSNGEYTFIVGHSNAALSMAFASDSNWNYWLGAYGGKVPNDGNYHHVLMAGNSSLWNWEQYRLTPLEIPGFSCFIDNRPSYMGFRGGGDSGFSTMLSPASWAVGGPGPGQATAPDSGFFTGNLGELYFFTLPSFQDITDQDFRSAFIDQNTLSPPRNASNGSGVIQNIRPQIYLSGGRALFGQNMTQRKWDLTSFVDTDPPSSFYASSGELQTATIDPWGFTRT